jgi:putative ABC transport system substrate-binding protein
MRRRDFIKGIAGSAAAWPFAAHAQQPALPVIGFLSSVSPVAFARTVVALQAAFRQGLSETGYVEGRNVAMEYRWAEGQYDRLPALAADLVSRQVAMIVATGGNAPAQAAKQATTQIPIVFVSGGDPVRAGLVASLNRPGGNITGVTMMYSPLVAKRLQLLHQLVPKAVAIGVMVNPNYPEADLQRRELQEAAETIRQQIQVVSASALRDIDAAFTSLVERKADALFVANDPFFESNRDHIVTLAARHAIPAIYSGREYVVAGGLMSYGSSLIDAFRQAGIYSEKILHGAKPADLPVMQPTKFELVINLKTAKMLGLDVPPTLMALADELIE